MGYQKAKYDISDALRESIEADMERGIQWKQIALEHGIEYGKVQSVGLKRRFRKQGEETTKGGVIRYWNGLRLTDGEPSPVKTYHISELQGGK
ncbi:hypothetical protein HMPREF3291_22475 [Bacillus sp. HMSC76G11]|nr:hypothetical protein HMPREF3291_22475 [Bacillus sp. HMSC76G11]